MLTKLDSLLLRAAQWVVDKVGGDYLGQRIARHLAYAACLGMILFFMLDYRWEGGLLIFICTVWMLNLWALLFMIRHIMRDISKGFMNPWGGHVNTRLIQLGFAILLLPFEMDAFRLAREACWGLFVACHYFASTDNPPPKKAEAKEDVTLLTPAPTRL